MIIFGLRVSVLSFLLGASFMANLFQVIHNSASPTNTSTHHLHAKSAVGQSVEKAKGLLRSSQNGTSAKRNDSANRIVLLPPVVSSNKTAKSSAQHEIVDFQKQDGVVVAVKIHGPAHAIQLKQSLCLFTAAYNHRVNYDIVVFTTLPLPDPDVREMQEIVHPASVSVYVDEKTLSDHLRGMNNEQRVDLLQRCNVTSTDELFWWTRCCEEGSTGLCMPLSYTWQAEFRSKWLWKHPALAPYKYMFWYDSDAFATRAWTQDPIAAMVRNNLVMFFDHWPQGRASSLELRQRIFEAYGRIPCSMALNEHGTFAMEYGNLTSCKGCAIKQIHGFFHITDLDFYRNAMNQHWFEHLIGDSKFSRKWDDQLAVTIPAIMAAPDRSMLMEKAGVVLDVWHNGLLDGIRPKNVKAGYQGWFKVMAETSFPEAFTKCQAHVRNGG